MPEQIDLSAGIARDRSGIFGSGGISAVIDRIDSSSQNRAQPCRERPWSRCRPGFPGMSHCCRRGSFFPNVILHRRNASMKLNLVFCIMPRSGGHTQDRVAFHFNHFANDKTLGRTGPSGETKMHRSDNQPDAAALLESPGSTALPMPRSGRCQRHPWPRPIPESVRRTHTSRCPSLDGGQRRRQDRCHPW
jgi:hypothetical protein